MRVWPAGERTMASMGSMWICVLALLLPAGTRAQANEDPRAHQPSSSSPSPPSPPAPPDTPTDTPTDDSTDVTTGTSARSPVDAPADNPAECGCDDGPAAAHVLEVTFGTAQLFNRESTATATGTVDTEIIPVSSALLMLEWLFMDQLSAALLATLPLEEQAVLVDGELRFEFAAPSVSLGLRGTPLAFPAFWDSTVELQLAAMLGRTLGSSSGDVFFPLVAGRVHVRTTEGFALYLGSAFAFERETLALIYGIGHRF